MTKRHTRPRGCRSAPVGHLAAVETHCWRLGRRSQRHIANETSHNSRRLVHHPHRLGGQGGDAAGTAVTRAAAGAPRCGDDVPLDCNDLACLDHVHGDEPRARLSRCRSLLVLGLIQETATPSIQGRRRAGSSGRWHRGGRSPRVRARTRAGTGPAARGGWCRPRRRGQRRAPELVPHPTDCRGELVGGSAVVQPGPARHPPGFPAVAGTRRHRVHHRQRCDIGWRVQAGVGGA